MSDEVRSKIKQARLRLNLSRFLAVSVWTFSVALLAGCGVILADKVWHWDLVVGTVVAWALAGGFAVAVIATVATARRSLDAAIEIDKAFGLKERISTLLSLRAEDAESSAAAALKADVESKVESLQVQDRIPIRVPRFGWLPAVPMAALLAMAYLVAPLEWVQPAVARTVKPEERKRISAETELLTKKLEERQKQLGLDEKLNEELQELTKAVENAGKDIGRDDKLGVKDAVLKLSDLAKSIEQQREQMRAVQQLQRALSKMDNALDGPADKFAQALKQGDFQQALQELKELQKSLKEGKLPADAQKKLASQLAEMQKQLEKAGDMKNREQQLRQSVPSNMLQQELAKLAQDAEKLKQLKELAEKLGKCSKCMEGEKDASKSAEFDKAMTDASQMLEAMLRDEKALEMVEGMLDDLAQCRNGMCQSDNPQMQDYAQGKGAGAGYRDIKEDETRSRQTRAKSELHKGPVMVVGRVQGKNFKGDSQLEVKQAVADAARAVDEAITRQKVPRDYQKHTQDYFEKLNGQVGQQ